MPVQVSGNVQSLERAFILLEVLAANSEGCSIKHLSGETGLHKSTVHRLLQTLMSFGYVRQEKSTERYHLGMAILSLSGALLDGLDIRTAARPLMQELCQKTGETVNLSVLSSSFAVFVDKVGNPNRTIQVYSQIGKSVPIYCSSSGKALLAWLPEEQAHTLLGEGPFRRYTPDTITDPEVLFEQLKVIRASGYAVDWAEVEENVFCVAAPIFDRFEQVVAAISISGTTLNVVPEAVLSLCKQINRTARLVSERLGCAHSPAVFNPPQS